MNDFWEVESYENPKQNSIHDFTRPDHGYSSIYKSYCNWQEMCPAKYLSDLEMSQYKPIKHTLGNTQSIQRTFLLVEREFLNMAGCWLTDCLLRFFR